MVVRNSHNESIHCLAFSPDGKFLASSSADKTIKLWNNDGKLNTVNIFSFPDMIEGIDYYKSMSDPRLDDYYLNQYDLDNDGDNRDLRAYFEGGSLSLRGYKTKTGIFDLGIGDISKDIDISGLSFTNRVVVDEPGHVYAVRTSSGGFALIKVRDIHIMTPEEMVRFKKQ